MKALRLFSLELGRLLQSRTTWLTALLTILSPAAGLAVCQPAAADTMLSAYLANPTLAGSAAGGILFGLLTVWEQDRACRSRVDTLIYTAVSPLDMALIRLAALAAAALLTMAAAALAWHPFIRKLSGSVFSETDYILSFVVFMGPALFLAILAASSAYHLAGRLDLSLVIFCAFAGLSLTVWKDNWQLCWLNPCVWALSDDFSNFRIFRSVAYMRLTWLTALSGVWILSWLCIRQWGRGLLASLACHSRQICRPIFAFFLLFCSCAAYIFQPMIDHSNPDLSASAFYELPVLEGVSCSGRTASVYPNTNAGTVSGTASYFFQNISGQTQIAAFGINPGYTVSSVKANGTDTPFTVSDYQEYNEAMLTATIPPDETAELVIEYSGFPKENRALASQQGSAEISSKYICLANADLAPRLMNVANTGLIPATIEITLPAHMTAIPFSTAQAEIVSRHDGGTATWRYQGTGAGGILYAGDYIRQDINAGGITVQLYYGRKHQAVMESAHAAESVRAVVDYCTEHYGPLSFSSGSTLKLIQSRVIGGGYAADGASLLDEADFTFANLNDSGKGAAPGEVMIHELVHQWWGLANMFPPTANTDPWSAEGLTVYTTYRIIKELYGTDYAIEHYVKQWQQEADCYYLNFYVRNPQYLEALPENKRLKISNRLAHVRQYCEMPLKILKAETLVGGETAMDEILHCLFTRELDWTFPYLTYQDFLDACQLTEEDLHDV